MKPLLPPRLRKGDCIGLISPASPVADTAKIDAGVRYLETLGYRVEVGKHATCVNGYLAGTDEERVTDLHDMVRNRKINAILAVRGGYGTPRLLPLIDYALFAKHPKILCGFSDLTALQLALWRKIRLVTFHGPMLASDYSGTVDPFTEEMFWRAVTSRKAIGDIALPAPARVLYGGKAKGRVIGGNLSLVAALLGTSYAPSFKKSILIIEEVGEEPYRIDRLLTQLRQAGAMKRTRAVLAGQFTDCQPKDSSKPSQTVDDVLKENADASGVPFLAGLPFGHVSRKLTFPIGIRVSVDGEKGRIAFEEAAVS